MARRGWFLTWLLGQPRPPRVDPLDARLARLQRTLRTIMRDYRTAKTRIRELEAAETSVMADRRIAVERAMTLAAQLDYQQTENRGLVRQILDMKRDGYSLPPVVAEAAPPPERERDMIQDATWLAAGGDIRLRRVLDTYVRNQRLLKKDDTAILHELTHWPEDDGAGPTKKD